MRRSLMTLSTLLLAFLPLIWIAGPPTILAQNAGSGSTVPAEIPASAKAVQNPVPASPQAIANGKMIFSSQCVMCHGKAGDGRGDLVDRLGLTVPDFTQAAVQQARSDGDLFFILTEGHGSMKGEGKRLGETTRWELIHYIRSLAPGT